MNSMTTPTAASGGVSVSQRKTEDRSRLFAPRGGELDPPQINRFESVLLAGPLVTGKSHYQAAEKKRKQEYEAEIVLGKELSVVYSICMDKSGKHFEWLL
ncbi:MAG: hypothetical protein KAR40_10415 [Candidatus Sabulitectum sp.]|nr:hypothetical protein [Candidatus Sabulitectum sp.]